MTMIQAHAPNRDHSDWRKGIALCGECHADQHPNLPRSLFLNKGRQPYWPNISARALAKEIGCHNRTVIRIAKKLEIPSGIPLSTESHKTIAEKVIKRITIADRCVICNNPFKPSEITNYARKQGHCYRCWEAKKLKLYTDARITFTCEACSKPFTKLRSEAKRMSPHFCSYECYNRQRLNSEKTKYHYTKLCKGDKCSTKEASAVRDARLGLGLSQREFATIINVTQTTVARWETGRFRPSRLAIKRIEDVLKVEEHDIHIQPSERQCTCNLD